MYRAAASHPDLTRARDELFTGGLYGFLQTFALTVRETQATHVIICKDCKPYRRSLDYPDYKLLRKARQDDELLDLYKASEPLVLELLELMGVPVWGVPGFESDDLVARLVESDRCRFVRIYAASNDSDLYQLLHHQRFAVFKDRLATVVDEEQLELLHGLTPEEYMLASALRGTHNDIAGIPGIGEKKAAQAVKDPAKLRALRDSHGDIIDRNLALIRLPHPDFPSDARMPLRISGASSRDLYRWLARFDIECTLSMVNAFEQLQPKGV